MSIEIMGLSQTARADAARVGTKAAFLGDLLQAGLAVPDGFVVVSTDAGHELGGEETEAIVAAWKRMGSGLVVVRSSAVEEDQTDASYAGQYESILGVDTVEGLLDSVRRCWSSGHSQRVSTYAEAHGRAGEDVVAVLVQQQVEADAAGIAFTANPVTGDRSEVVINAVEGLADRVAAGEVTPQQWLVHDDGTVELTSGGTAGITSDQAREVAGLARRVEGHFGAPQDIEWAIAAGQVYLLQARPITALPDHVEPVPVAVNVPEGYWQRDAGHAPQPNTPMYSSLVLPHANVAGKAWFAEYGFLLDGMEWREIGGWQYITLRPLGGKPRKPPPPWLVPLLRRLVPPLRSRVRACIEAVRSDRAGHNLHRWYEEWKPDLRSRAETMRAVSLTDLTDDGLRTHLDSVSSLIADALMIHFILHGAGFLHVGELIFTSRELLGWDDREIIDLLSGLSGTSTEPAAKLNELAQKAGANPELLTALRRPEPASMGDLAGLAPDFVAALQFYLDVYGYRALRYEIVDPTLAETPELLLQMVRDQVATGFDSETNMTVLRQRADAKVEEARRTLEDHPSDLERFERALQRAQIAYPVREDSEFFTVSVPLGLTRLAILELGTRLGSRGQIATRDDVFFLEYDQARRLFASAEEAFDVVQRRKGERAWILAHPGPGSHGPDPGPPPSLAGFPPEVRFAMNALLWAVERTFETELSARIQNDPGRIQGIGASPGSYSGTARRVMDETQFDKIRAGDVLVCPITSPVWSVVFPSLGALVADTGGILSHPAIIAREYRIPAVVATGNATSLINDGQRVTVDGTTGVVEIG